MDGFSWLRRLGEGDAANGALVITGKVLKGAKEAASEVPVPGLGIVFELLDEVLTKAKTSRATYKSLKELRVEMGRLCQHLDHVMSSVQATIARYSPGSVERKGVEDGLAHSGLLLERIDTLKRELQEVADRAAGLSQDSWFSRWFFSEQDAEILRGLKEQIAHAREQFQSDSIITVEALVSETLDRLVAEADDRVLKQLLPEVDAGFRAAVNEMKSHYLEGTRQEVFQRLHDWSTGSTAEWQSKRVMFLRGEAGIGKSTIATELCRRLEESKLLGASFFFTRNVQKLDSTELFFPTIAVQLANLQRTLRPYIIDAARHYLQSGKVQRMQYAFEQLVQKPLRSLPQAHAPIVIVVDALDECTEKAAELVPEFLRLLLGGAIEPSSPLRILILSRPEMHYVREVLDSAPFADVVYTLSLYDFSDSANRDIHTFIETKLNSHEWSRTWYSSNPEVANRLTERSRGVFVYAQTATSFLLSSPDNLTERLALLLSVEKPIGLSDLDALYLTVLNTAFPLSDMYDTHKARIRLVLGYIAVIRDQTGGLTPRTLEFLTGMPCEESISILNKLRSVILFEYNNPDSQFRLVHLTFREFLVGEKSPEPFRVDAASAHSQLALNCMAVLLLYVNPLGWKPPPDLEKYKEINGRSPGRNRPYSFQVWYAVTHCQHHRSLAGSMDSQNGVGKTIMAGYETMTKLHPIDYWIGRPVS